MFSKVYCFSYTLREVIKQRTRDSSFIHHLITSLEDHCERIAAWLKAKQSVSILCRDLYDQIDEVIKEQQPPDISCRKGCAYCCKQYVAVTRSEATHLLRIARAGNIPIDEGLLARQREATDVEWLNLPSADKACVFLDPTTQECRVYRDRPLACRKYFVISDPEICNIEKHPTARAHVWYQIDAEIVNTSWMTVDEAGSLPNLLLKEIQR